MLFMDGNDLIYLKVRGFETYLGKNNHLKPSFGSSVTTYRR